jgi:hypothetical protein
MPRPTSFKMPLWVWIAAIIAFSSGLVFIAFGSTAAAHHKEYAAILLVALGTLLTGAIGAAVLLEAILAKTHIDQIRDSIAPVINESLRSVRHTGVNFGVQSVTKKSDQDWVDLFRNLEPDEELLWLDTSAPKPGWYDQSLPERIRNGTKVRILILDPDSENAKYRATEASEQWYLPSEEQEEAEKHFRSEAVLFIEQLSKVGDRLQTDLVKGRLQVALYPDLPGVPLYLIKKQGHPDLAWTSFFLNNATYEQVHFDWTLTSKDSVLLRLAHYFDRKWERTVRDPKRLIIDTGDPAVRNATPAERSRLQRFGSVFKRNGTSSLQIQVQGKQPGKVN